MHDRLTSHFHCHPCHSGLGKSGGRTKKTRLPLLLSSSWHQKSCPHRVSLALTTYTQHHFKYFSWVLLSAFNNPVLLVMWSLLQMWNRKLTVSRWPAHIYTANIWQRWDFGLWITFWQCRHTYSLKQSFSCFMVLRNHLRTLLKCRL